MRGNVGPIKLGLGYAFNANAPDDKWDNIKKNIGVSIQYVLPISSSNGALALVKPQGEFRIGTVGHAGSVVGTIYGAEYCRGF